MTQDDTTTGGQPRPWLPLILLAGGVGGSIWLAGSTAGASAADPGGLVLALGLILAVVLAASVWLAQLAAARARQLAELNDRLWSGTLAARESEAHAQGLSQDLEERVAMRTRDLEAAIEQLDTFNYTVSHDLRSPLGAILNYVAILEEDYAGTLEEEGLEFLARIAKNAHSAVSLMESMLVYSRVARRDLQIEAVQLEPIVQEEFQSAGDLAGRDDIELDVSDVPAIRGDAELLRVAMRCLVENSAKLPRNGRRTTLSVAGDFDGTDVRVRLHDSTARVDARSTSLENAAANLGGESRLEGRGVALATVSRIVDRLGGQAWIESPPAGGATYYLQLPRA